MTINMRLDLRQTQTLVLTPQLQQAIKLLQMSSLEVMDAVGREVLENPFLEVQDNETAQEGPKSASQDGAVAGTDEGWNQPDQAPSNDTSLGVRSTGTASSAGNGGDDRSFEETISGSLSMQDHLIEQIGLVRADAAVRQLAMTLVAWLDHEGYLRESDQELALAIGIDDVAVAHARTVMQTCDPAGVGARDLAECLRLQLQRIDRCDPAMEILLKNLPALARAEFSSLQRRCKVDAEDLQDMIAELRLLDPKPGSSFEHQRIDSAIPDVFVYRFGKTAWRIELNEAIQPRILVDTTYQSQIDTGSLAKAEKDYIGERLQSANWLAKALDQRSKTILKVATAIFRRQTEFLEHGPAALRPLVLRNIAELTNLHESTVSRATSDKFVSTPHGTFPLKYFFTAAIQGASGDDTHSAEVIRIKIKRLIENECADDVLSDDRIVDILKNDGVMIARRTVAKYREKLNILSSSKRRRALMLQAS